MKLFHAYPEKEQQQKQNNTFPSKQNAARETHVLQQGERPSQASLQQEKMLLLLRNRRGSKKCTSQLQKKYFSPRAGDLSGAACVFTFFTMMCKSALTWIIALIWNVCHIDGLLLLLAASPAAGKAFLASIEGTAALPGWQLLYSWQAVLPLLLLGCCCIALYHARVLHPRTIRHRSYGSILQTQQARLKASPTCRTSSSSAATTLRLSRRLHAEGVMPPVSPPQQETEQQRQWVVLQEPLQRLQQQRNAPGFSYAEDDQLKEEKKQKEQQSMLLTKPQHVSSRGRWKDASLPQKQTQQQIHKRKTHTRYAEEIIRKDTTMENAATFQRHKNAYESSSRRFIILGGYSAWERCLDVSEEAAVPDRLPVVATAEQQRFKKLRSRDTSVTFATSAAGDVLQKNNPNIDASPVDTNPSRLFCRCVRRKKKRKQISTPEENAPASTSPYGILTATGRALLFNFQHGTRRLLSLAATKKSSALVHHKFSLQRIKSGSLFRCVSLALIGSNNKQDTREREEGDDEEKDEEEEGGTQEAAAAAAADEEEENVEEEADTASVQRLALLCASNNSSAPAAKKDVDRPVMQKDKDLMLEASGVAGLCPRLSGDLTSRRVYTACILNDSGCVALPDTSCKCSSSTAFPPAAFDLAPSVPSDQSCREKETPASGVDSSDTPSKAKQSKDGRAEKGNVGQRSSSAFVAVLLFPAFLCCCFPSVDKQTAALAAGARTQMFPRANTFSLTDSYSYTKEQLTVHQQLSFFRDDAAAPANLPLVRDVLRVTLSLLPASLVAGSLVSLLLWHCPPAVVGLCEVGWLIIAYTAAWVATCWCSCHHIAITAGVALSHPQKVASAPPRETTSVPPSLLSFLKTGSQLRSLSQLDMLALYCVYAAIIGACIALQLLYFHSCFKKAQRCFSLVEGILVAQLATGLTYVSALYTLYCYSPVNFIIRECGGFRLLSAASFTSGLSKSSASSFSTGSNESATLRDLSVPSAFYAPAEAAWRAFASHVWLLLLLLIGCTLLLTVSDEKLCAPRGDDCESKGLSSQNRKADIQFWEKQQSEKSRVLRGQCRKRVKVLLSLFAVALVGYLCRCSMRDPSLFSISLPKRTLHTSGSNPLFASSTMVGSQKKKDSISALLSSDNTPHSDVKTSATGLGTAAPFTNATGSPVAEIPLMWAMRLIAESTQHTSLFLLWFALSAAGIPIVSAMTTRAAFLRQTATSEFCWGARVITTGGKLWHSVGSQCSHTAENRSLTGGDDCANKRKSVLLKVFARKLFHFLLVTVVATGHYTGAHMFTALSLCGLLWIFVLCEYIRVSRVIPKLSSQLTKFFSRFADCRDENGLFLTHIYLLLGVALPLVAVVARENPINGRAPTVSARYATGDTTETYNAPYAPGRPSPPLRELSDFNAVDARNAEHMSGVHLASPKVPLRGSADMPYGGAAYVAAATEETTAARSFPSSMALQSLLGLLLVGVGDAASALAGMRWGTRKMPFTKRKTCVGTAAFFVSPALLIFFFVNTSPMMLAEQWNCLRAGLFATGLATLFEAYTPDIDNCILSLFGVVAYNGALLVL